MATLVGSVLRRSVSSTSRLAKEIEYASATAGGHGGGLSLWRKISFFVGFPAVGLCMLNCYLGLKEGHDEPPPFKKWDHMRLRGKRYPWGDGNHSLFHNPHANPLPDGFEEHH